jgi:pimeloyl-ACP methyl ester carboxylesterase
MSRDVTALFDHLGLTEVDVVGYSMGAAVALKVALSDSRVHRLVVGGSDGYLVAHPPSAAALERRKHIASALLTKDAATIGDSSVRRLRAFAESTGSDLEALAAIQLAPHRYGQPADLSALCVPALVVCGNEDVSPESLASHLPHATAIIVPGTHETALHSHDFVATVVDFLA